MTVLGRSVSTFGRLGVSSWALGVFLIAGSFGMTSAVFAHDDSHQPGGSPVGEVPEPRNASNSVIGTWDAAVELNIDGVHSRLFG